MVRNKICILSFLFVILFTPLKVIYSDELERIDTTLTYNNYYFFIEKFGPNNSNIETVNYGLFAPPRLGHIGDTLELVKLSRNSNNPDEDVIDTFLKYYQKKHKEKSVKFVAFDDEKYCLIASYEKRNGSNINIYYTHGCYKNASGWHGFYRKNDNGEYCDSKGVCVREDSLIINDDNLFEYACASVDRFTWNGASIISITEGMRDINGNLETVYSSDKYSVFKITRAKLEITNDEPTDYSKVKIDEDKPFDVNTNNSSCPTTEEHHVNRTSDGTLYSPVLGKYSYSVVYHECREENVDLTSNCNSSETVGQTCSLMTIEAGDNNNGTSSRADFSVTQTGTISNVLTPSTIYQGGGIKNGFIYYNTVDWKYDSGSLNRLSGITEEGAKADLLSALKAKIKSSNEVVNDLNFNFNITPEIRLGNDINNNLIKNCKQTVTGGFDEGSVTTVCTVFLPVTNIQPYTGKISGISSEIGDNVNNKFYTELDYSGIINVSANVSGLNVLKNSSNWSINYNPSNNDSSCQVEVYNRLYVDRGTGDKFNKYKFVYRPIDLGNPFPGRIAGANWYDWYKKEVNQSRLKEAYSKLQYRVQLNPARIANIKEYNNGKSYLDWDGFENGNSSFINNEFQAYFDIKGQNIVGDGS